MTARSNTAAVRNPIAADPEIAALIRTVPRPARRLLEDVLRVLAKRWNAQAEKSWRTHKPPLAAYWKANAVNARHLAIALNKVDR